MLTDVIRKSLEKVPNRFELVALASERCQQLLHGARATVENPTRERWMKVAAREIASGRLHREGEEWKVDRPASMEVFVPPLVARPEDEEIFRFRDDEEE